MITDDGSRIMEDQSNSNTLVNVAQVRGVYSSSQIISHHKKNPDLIDSFYEIEKCSNMIIQYKFNKIALQFPDELLPDAPQVIWKMKHCVSKLMQSDSQVSCPSIPESIPQYHSQIEIGKSDASETPIDIEDSVVMQSPSNSQNEHAIHLTSNLSKLDESIMTNPIATTSTTSLSQNFEPKFYILGDTSYGSCCVDEIAAQHIDADFIIHFGNACLNYVRRLPVLHVFGMSYTIDTEKCMQSLLKYLSKVEYDNDLHEDNEKGDNVQVPVVVLYDLIYERSVRDIEKKLSGKNQNIIFAKLPSHRVFQNAPYGSELSPASEQDDARQYEVNGLVFNLPKSSDLKYKYFYIGEDSVRMVQVMLQDLSIPFFRYSGIKNIASDDNDLKMGNNRLLKRRYYLMNCAKEAQVFGIIVATVTIANYMDILEYTKKVLTEHGKQFYVFFVGKLNVPKLANFSEIDMYVLIGCGMNSLIDGKEFFKPIITPFELDIAMKNKDWAMQNFVTDFNRLLSMKDEEMASESSDKGDEPEFSLISGKLQSKSKITLQNSSSDLQLSLLSSDHEKQLLLAQQSPALAKLHQRTYQGLEQNLGETPVGTMKQGREGIPKNYSN